MIHSDLRPENFLVNASTPTSFDLWLCDLSGSACKELDIDGGSLPDAGCFNHNSPWESTTDADTFSLGSLLYAIVTARLPCRKSGPFELVDDMEHHRQKVDNLFGRGKFPDVKGPYEGKIIMGCWRHEYIGVDDIVGGHCLIEFWVPLWGRSEVSCGAKLSNAN